MLGPIKIDWPAAQFFKSPHHTHQMGQLYSSDCVDLSEELSPENYEKLVGETYTVVRTNKEEQEGFVIPREEHDCNQGGNQKFYPASHATCMTQSGQQKVFMTSSGEYCRDRCRQEHEHLEHVCGWRTCVEGRRDFWPSRLKTQEEREEWFKWLDSIMAPIDFPTQKKRDLAREEQAKKEAEEQERIRVMQYEQAEARMKLMLKLEAERVKERTGCKCEDVMECKPCVYSAQGRPLDS
jgi:hypothetical protein